MDETERAVQENMEHYEEKMEKLYLENEHLRNQLSHKNKEIKKLRRIINKRNKQDKQHFKNGKRGTMKNGG